MVHREVRYKNETRFDKMEGDSNLGQVVIGTLRIADIISRQAQGLSAFPPTSISYD